MTGGRRWILGAVLAYLAILAVVFLGLRHLHAGARERLDEAMGQRLLGVARSIVALSDGDVVFNATLGDSSAAAYVHFLGGVCEQIRVRENLAEITFTDPLDQRVLLTTAAALRRGEANPYWALDPEAVGLAAAGEAVATDLYELPAAPGTFQKSAHVPLYKYLGETTEPVAVVTVSGSPDFFAALRSLERAAWVTGIAVLAILFGLGVGLWRINLALQRIRASAQRQENLAAMGRMTAGIAHEIRNPLGIIRGAGQHLQEVLARAGVDDEVAAFIPEEVDRLDRILTGYLAFGSDRAAAPEPFAVADCVRRGVRLAVDELAADGVTVVADDLAPALVVQGDPRRLQQVILNLLLNARDAMVAGGRIEVTLSRAGGEARLEIGDEGRGLHGIDEARLFEPFWTDKEKGSGLGLAMSRRIVEDMGGRLVLRDRPDGKGAVAAVSLPLVSTAKG